MENMKINVLYRTTKPRALIFGLLDWTSTKFVQIMTMEPKMDPLQGRISLYKINFLENTVMLHIQLRGMAHTITCSQTFCPYTHPWPLGGVKMSFFAFSESSHVVCQINRL